MSWNRLIWCPDRTAGVPPRVETAHLHSGPFRPPATPAVPAGNWGEFRALTEAAEVLFDAGQTDVYSLRLAC